MREKEPVRIGSVVFSRAGRDQGRYYLVVEIIDDAIVGIADGKGRKLSKPKHKSLKHLKDTGDVVEGIAEKLINGAVVYDAEVFSALKKYNL